MSHTPPTTSLPADPLHHTPYIQVSTSSPTPIYLTPFLTTDAPALQQTHSHPSIYPPLLSTPYPYTLTHAHSWIALQLSGQGNLPLQVLRVGDPKTGQLIGCVSLMPSNSSTVLRLCEKIPNSKACDEEFQLGYYLHPDFRGQGIVRAALKALLAWGATCGVRNVAVKVLEDNVSSRKVIEGVREFVRRQEKDEWIEWPAEKGGGNRKLLVWTWSL